MKFIEGKITVLTPQFLDTILYSLLYYGILDLIHALAINLRPKPDFSQRISQIYL